MSFSWVPNAVVASCDLLLALGAQVSLRVLDLLQVRGDGFERGGDVGLGRAPGAERGQRVHLGLDVGPGGAHLACGLLLR